MIPAQFDYVAPDHPRGGARGARPSTGDDAKIIAGGQSLLPVLRMRLNAPEMVIDLGKIDALRGVRDDGDAIVIGAMTTHVDVLNDALVRENAFVITKAVEQLADPQVRHRGTFGGALAHADPAGDLGAPALALDAQFVIAGPGGERTVEADDFFVDLFDDRDRGGRDPQGGPDPEAAGLGRALREVRARRPPVADRRGRRGGQGRRRHDQRGARRA